MVIIHDEMYIKTIY